MATVLLTAVIYLALGAPFVWGSVGVVRAAVHAGRRHARPLWFRYPLVAAAVFAAVGGGWLLYSVSWPFVRLARTRSPEAGSLDWIWVPAPGWPIPPQGYQPHKEWSPPPTWPPPPPGHVFWQRSTRGRWRRRRLMAAAVSTVLLLGGCLAAASTAGPCAFDPPPGDQLAVKVTNDTPSPVAVVDCLDQRCTSAQSRLPIAAGAHVSMPLEGCAGGTMGVLDPSTNRLRNCIAEPTEDQNFSLHDIAISVGRTCQGTTDKPVQIAPGG